MSGEGLWDFSLRVYGAPGVADWCLLLQDRHGADVNLLLWCAWVGSLGILLQARDLAVAQAAATPWRDAVVRPLRSVRLALKGDLGAVTADMAVALRTRVKAVELESERVQQAMLAALLDQGRIAQGAPSAPARQAVAANLTLYLQRLECPPDIAATALEEAALRPA